MPACGFPPGPLSLYLSLSLREYLSLRERDKRKATHSGKRGYFFRALCVFNFFFLSLWKKYAQTATWPIPPIPGCPDPPHHWGPRGPCTAPTRGLVGRRGSRRGSPWDTGTVALAVAVTGPVSQWQSRSHGPDPPAWPLPLAVAGHSQWHCHCVPLSTGTGSGSAQYWHWQWQC